MKTLIMLVLVSVSATTALASDIRESPIPGWQEIVFEGRTDYVMDEDKDCVRAEADGTASGLIREKEVDLEDTPLLRWAWRAEQPLRPGKEAPERKRAGDDFVARVYVIREGFFRWQTRAVNYVWSREHEVGEHWPNPYTGNAVMVSVQYGEEGLGEWQEFERNVREDFRRFHDRDIDRIDAVAIMTDADDTEGRAVACYRMPDFSPSS